MREYLDIERWARRDLFEFFRSYDDPYFNICTRLDVTRLLLILRDHPEIAVSLAYYYFALRVANEVEPFRYRLQDDKIVIYSVINGGTTVLLPNETFTYAYFDYHENLETFVREAGRSVRQVQNGSGELKPSMRDDLIYFTTLPWVSFTSFAHAHKKGRGDSVPRIAFGKFVKVKEQTLLPISVEVHHALMDGLHVGRYLSRLEEALTEPEVFLYPGR